MKRLIQKIELYIFRYKFIKTRNRLQNSIYELRAVQYQIKHRGYLERSNEIAVINEKLDRVVDSLNERISLFNTLISFA